jgi:two-component system, chemotaxis family, chemotaxis protein CheY
VSEKRTRVLIVDDARFMRMMLCDLLSKSGLDVVGQAADGDEALEEYRRTRPDVMTLDIMMPRSDGLRALQAILSEDPQARIVVVSAIEHNDTVERALELGAADYVLKPFSPHRIVEVLKRAAGGDGRYEVDEEID